MDADSSSTAVLQSECSTEAARHWEQTRRRFLAAVTSEQRGVVDELLQHRDRGGAGLRDWLASIAWRGADLPDSIPPALLAVYLQDSDAAALHDCEDCGLAIPVKPNPRYGGDGELETSYFPVCPCCGGRTGLYLRSSKIAEDSRQASDSLKRARPR